MCPEPTAVLDCSPQFQSCPKNSYTHDVLISDKDDFGLWTLDDTVEVEHPVSRCATHNLKPEARRGKRVDCEILGENPPCSTGHLRATDSRDFI